ncbi:MAG: tRNA pseudouridine(38-40) synthase TruA [Bacillota bacterium]|uniref:tRNA pseudouridine(38-40) synthase TruA n=1 Tax=Desulforudis sp. DRI-14 TaxID=3459793 RepID=UPI0034826EE2
MRNIKLVLAYDGTAYCGFQVQRGSGLPTIQETLEKCLASLAHTETQVTAAGRTDAGVHARGQVVNFHTGTWNIPTERIVPALNSVLPPDIAAVSAQEVPFDFHARYSAVSKTYSYTIDNGPVPSPFWRFYSYYVRHPLDEGRMKAATAFLLGEHDFSSFQAAGRPVKSAVRTIYRAEVTRDGRLVRLEIEGNGFLYQMVRIIAGTLIRVGLGRWPPERVGDILAARSRAAAGPTAPPQGLCLEYVKY